MKKSILIVLLFMPLLLQSCQKEQDEYDYVTWIDHEVIVCGVEDPVNNLPWISSDVLSVPMPFSGLLHLYEDTVMHEDIVVCDWRDWIAVYTCSGQLIADGVYTSLNVPDVVYEGNSTKWVKYANSLMLRLAMRLRTANDVELQQLAKQYAKQAITHSIGVMTEVSDAAGAGKGAGITLRNPIFWIADNYNDARIGTSILSYLIGYADPRIGAYCEPANNECTVAITAFDGNKYQGVPMGHSHTRSDEKTPEKDAYYYYSKPNIKGETPLYWMRASEVYFLRAEAALFWGAEFGNAEELYKQGIATSFQENGVQGSVDQYIASGKKPAAMNNNSWKYGFSFAAPCQTTAMFTGSDEEKFEKIIIQKYIAMFPNGQEAWTEFRRTGYPKLNPILPGGNHNSSISSERGIRRMIYPVSFNGTGDAQKIYQDAVQKLGGPDRAETDLIWAKRN